MGARELPWPDGWTRERVRARPIPETVRILGGWAVLLAAIAGGGVLVAPFAAALHPQQTAVVVGFVQGRLLDRTVLVLAGIGLVLLAVDVVTDRRAPGSRVRVRGGGGRRRAGRREGTSEARTLVLGARSVWDRVPISVGAALIVLAIVRAVSGLVLPVVLLAAVPLVLGLARPVVRAGLAVVDPGRRNRLELTDEALTWWDGRRRVTVPWTAVAEVVAVERGRYGEFVEYVGLRIRSPEIVVDERGPGDVSPREAAFAEDVVGYGMRGGAIVVPVRAFAAAPARVFWACTSHFEPDTVGDDGRAGSNSRPYAEPRPFPPR